MRTPCVLIAINSGDDLLRTYLRVRARAPTDVAKEFATSFAPTPRYYGKRRREQRTGNVMGNFDGQF